MNSKINRKTPAFIYAKEFKLTKVLGNLQAYKLAVGDVGQAELHVTSKEHGNNLGAVYGSLITKASVTERNKRKGDDGGKTGVSNRKRRRNKKGRSKPDVNIDIEWGCDKRSVEQTTIELDQPLPLPDCLLKENEHVSDSLQQDSSDESEEEVVDFFGLSSSAKTKKDLMHSAIPVPTGDTSSRIPPKSCSSGEATRRQENENVHELTTYRCWKCKRRGHLAEHCTIQQGNTMTPSTKIASNRALSRIDLQDLYLQCRRLKHSKNANCNECGNTSNLAYCFECGLTLCDGRGHLIDHLLNFPSHTKIYSHKLQRLLKCSNSSCDVVDTSQLLTCSQCLSKTFDRHYSLVNATWSERGLRSITNAITCEDHFHWHRMNCYNSFEEPLLGQDKMEQLKRERNGLLSEFFF